MQAQTRRQLLLRVTSTFCQALTEPSPDPAALISTYFVPGDPRITEHGPAFARSRLPFLAKTFTGPERCEEYFVLLAQTLKMHMSSDTFPTAGSGGYVVDVDAEGGKGVVSVVGKARFVSVKTAKWWDEEFIYRFSGFDGEGRIEHWEIWADPLSAWEAVEGRALQEQER